MTEDDDKDVIDDVVDEWFEKNFVTPEDQQRILQGTACRPEDFSRNRAFYDEKWSGQAATLFSNNAPWEIVSVACKLDLRAETLAELIYRGQYQPKSCKDNGKPRDMSWAVLH